MGTPLEKLRAATTTTSEVEVNGEAITLTLPRDVDIMAAIREEVLGSVQNAEGDDQFRLAISAPFRAATICLSALIEDLDADEASQILTSVGGEQSDLARKSLELMGLKRYFPQVFLDDLEDDELDPTST